MRTSMQMKIVYSCSISSLFISSLRPDRSSPCKRNRAWKRSAFHCMAAHLPRRHLGKTGLQVSVLGFGASPLGGVFEEITDEQGVEAVHEAFRLGINFFDTSPYYGATRSEKVLGLGLKGLPRSEVVVCTKVGRYGQDTFDFSAERVTTSVHESLQRLQLDYVDIVQCHDVEFGHLDQIIEETLPALQQLKQQGLVRFIGITGLPLKVYKYILDKVPPGTVDVVLSYCHYCLNDQSLADLIPYLKEKEVGIINASPLSMGLLTQQGPPLWHPAPPELKEACQQAATYCSTQGADLASLALKFALSSHPEISTTLVGMATKDMVNKNVELALEALGARPAGDAVPKPQQVLSEVERILESVKNMSWPSGRPENN